MKILLACEESQAVTKEFRELGHEAYSCDMLETSGSNPEWHIQGDALEVMGTGAEWDMIIAFPPCTYLSVAGNTHFNIEKWGDKARQRHRDRDAAFEFFMAFANADCPRIAVENPVGFVSTMWRKPDQIIHPYYFGDPFQKRTCLWLKGLPLLQKTNVVEHPPRIYYKNGKSGTEWLDNASHAERDRIRSKTFPGIARAMATQWG